MRRMLPLLLIASLFSACGGGDIEVPPPAVQKANPVVMGSLPSRLAPVVLTGLRSNYTVLQTAAGMTVTDKAGNTRQLPIGMRLRFDDITVAYDIDGFGGQAFRLYQAAFNRSPDLAGLGYWIDALDSGYSLLDVAQGFMNSEEFRAGYGANPPNDLLVNRFYSNVLHRAGDPGGVKFWTGMLDSRQMSRAAVLLGFSESLENQLGVQAGLQSGIPFLEQNVSYVPTAVTLETRRIAVNSVITLDASASTGTVGHALSYRWLMVARPAGSAAGLVQANSARPSFLPDQPGIYDIQLVVSDGARSSATVTVRVTAF